MSKPIQKSWRFRSSSGEKLYETLLYTDGRTSCDCPGWTRRVAEDGTRTCKHVRSVLTGFADREAEQAQDHAYATAETHTPPAPVIHPTSECRATKKSTRSFGYGKRKLAS